MDKIDFVILWVDGNDPIWKEEKNKYSPKLKNDDNNGENRFRDWDNLKYWFRSVEINASWVNRIFFITWGHVPNWLNLENPKLKVVKHSDYIPKEYLPTYNSNTIEMNLYRLKDLSENFVLFNDDMFIMNKTKPEDFFKNGLPVEIYSERIAEVNKPNDPYIHTLVNNIAILNKYYLKKEVYKKSLFKYINFKYGIKNNLSTIILSMFKNFSMIDNAHVAVPLKKSVLEHIWQMEFEILDNASKNKFRNLDDVSQYLIRYFQLASGNFYPRKYKESKMYKLKDDNTFIGRDIEKKKYKLVCFNDSLDINNFEQAKKSLNVFLSKRYNIKSSYEI